MYAIFLPMCPNICCNNNPGCNTLTEVPIRSKVRGWRRAHRLVCAPQTVNVKTTVCFHRALSLFFRQGYAFALLCFALLGAWGEGRPPRGVRCPIHSRAMPSLSLSLSLFLSLPAFFMMVRTFDLSVTDACAGVQPSPCSLEDCATPPRPLHETISDRTGKMLMSAHILLSALHNTHSSRRGPSAPGPRIVVYALSGAQWEAGLR